ncbi:hypothetical protein Peur_066803 [Populus x canadensis]
MSLHGSAVRRLLAVEMHSIGNHKSGNDDLHKNGHGHGHVFTPSLSSLQSSLQSPVISAHDRSFLFINSDDDLLNNSRLRASSSIFINSDTPTTISFLSHHQQLTASSSSTAAGDIGPLHRQPFSLHYQRLFTVS